MEAKNPGSHDVRFWITREAPNPDLAWAILDAVRLRRQPTNNYLDTAPKGWTQVSVRWVASTFRRGSSTVVVTLAWLTENGLLIRAPWCKTDNTRHDIYAWANDEEALAEIEKWAGTFRLPDPDTLPRRRPSMVKARQPVAVAKKPTSAWERQLSEMRRLMQEGEEHADQAQQRTRDAAA